MSKLTDVISKIKNDVVEFANRKVDELTETFIELTPEEEKRLDAYCNQAKMSLGELSGHLEKISHDVLGTIFLKLQQATSAARARYSLSQQTGCVCCRCLCSQ